MNSIKRILLILLTLFLYGNVDGFSLKKLYGTKPTENSIAMGSLAYHYIVPRGQIFFPYADLALKNSLFVNVFENSFFINELYKNELKFRGVSSHHQLRSHLGLNNNK